MKSFISIRNVGVFGIFLLIGTFVTTEIRAQERRRSFFNQMSVGLGASSYGGRLEVAFPMGNYFTLRGGFSMLPFSLKKVVSISATEYRKYIDYDPDLNMTAKLSFSNAHILADLTPISNGMFHITLGVFLGSSKINLDGILLNPNTQNPTLDDLRKAGYVGEELPEITWEDSYKIQPEKDGRVRASLVLGGKVKPYFGIGIGRTLPESRVSLSLEAGVIYQGRPDLSSPNLISGDLNDYLDKSEEVQPYKKYLPFWPMINLQINIRIF